MWNEYSSIVHYSTESGLVLLCKGKVFVCFIQEQRSINNSCSITKKSVPMLFFGANLGQFLLLDRKLLMNIFAIYFLIGFGCYVCDSSSFMQWQGKMLTLLASVIVNVHIYNSIMSFMRSFTKYFWSISCIPHQIPLITLQVTETLLYHLQHHNVIIIISYSSHFSSSPILHRQLLQLKCTLLPFFCLFTIRVKKKCKNDNLLIIAAAHIPHLCGILP